MVRFTIEILTDEERGIVLLMNTTPGMKDIVRWEKEGVEEAALAMALFDGMTAAAEVYYASKKTH